MEKALLDKKIQTCYSLVILPDIEPFPDTNDIYKYEPIRPSEYEYMGYLMELGRAGILKVNTDLWVNRDIRKLDMKTKLIMKLGKCRFQKFLRDWWSPKCKDPYKIPKQYYYYE